MQADALPSEPAGKPTTEPQEKVTGRAEDFLAIQWLRSHASTAGRTCSTPGQGAKIHIPSSVEKKKKRVEAFFINM